MHLLEAEERRRKGKEERATGLAPVLHVSTMNTSVL